LQPIIIAGFGRSGTTWVSDIVSKTIGGLILFEPDHPNVYAESKEALYNPDLTAMDLQAHLKAISSKSKRDAWLIRNHLLSDEDQPKELIDSIWRNSEIIGFKCIRWNHALPALASISAKKLIYIIRHPLSVVASLMKRPRFFLDFDWETHWSVFKERNPLKEVDLKQYDQSEMSIKYAAMWSITNIKALYDLQTLGIPFWSYEQLYHKPYETAQSMNAYLGYSKTQIHPSYIFYPSMSTLRTFHTNNTEWPSFLDEDISIFWKDTLNDEMCVKVVSEIQKIAASYSEAASVFGKLGYFKT
tara:strand:- start:128 stop:1030 length:903 start_codon:yes stop_codon:yes gene_type:complete